MAAYTDSDDFRREERKSRRKFTEAFEHMTEEIGQQRARTTEEHRYALSDAERSLASAPKPSEYDNDQYRKLAGFGVGIASLFAENILSHPLIVLRRQCQVNSHSICYHLTPFTIVPVWLRLHSRQGFGCAWKGMGSIFIVRGVTMVSEDVLSKVSNLPKNVTKHTTLKQFAEHLLLKALSCAIVTPLYSASVVETVQSDIASEKPGLLDCFREGVSRLFCYTNHPQTQQILPVWLLVIPTVMHGVLQYSISLSIQHCILSVHRSKKQRLEKLLAGNPQSVPKKHSYLQSADEYYVELISTFAGRLVADIALYPLETVLHRLHIQGTRTIVDNLDTGTAVIPIVTRYEGFVDCYRSIIKEEGKLGLYKGFGALVLQYLVYLGLLKLTKTIFDKLDDDRIQRESIVNPR